MQPPAASEASGRIAHCTSSIFFLVWLPPELLVHVLKFRDARGCLLHLLLAGAKTIEDQTYQDSNDRPAN